MAKLPAKIAPRVSTDHIDKAAGTTLIKDITALGDAFARAALLGPFRTALPLLGSVFIADKGYRKINIPAGTLLEAKEISIGKRAGLIFKFDCVGDLRNSHGDALYVEMGWDDLINMFDELAESVEKILEEGRSTRKLVKIIDADLKIAVGSNPAMHTVLSKGLVLAQVHSREAATQDGLQDLPGFGSF